MSEMTRRVFTTLVSALVLTGWTHGSGQSGQSVVDDNGVLVVDDNGVQVVAS